MKEMRKTRRLGEEETRRGGEREDCLFISNKQDMPF
jgi:hypothetical protein